jgi:tetratricopeptide (TPR) repeat protein
MKENKKKQSKVSKLVKKLGIGNKQVNKNLLILLSLFLLSTLIIMLFSIFVLQSVLTNSYLSQKEKQNRFYFWMEKIGEYPNSPDVLYNAALSANAINKNETALNLLKKALTYDPLFIEAKNLQEEIVKEVR